MSTIPLRPEDERRGFAAAMAAHAYEQAARSRPQAGESLALRERAHAFAGGGAHAEALPLYQRALQIMPDDGHPSTCSARFDLAVAYLAAPGVERERLLEARRLLERILDEPAWRADIKRVALGKDALGQTLRRLAALAQGEDRVALERAALSAFEDACRALAPLGSIGWVHACCYHQNLGNLLLQIGLPERAIHAYQDAVRLARSVEAHRERKLVASALYTRQDDLLADALVSLAHGLCTSRRPEQLKRALAAADEAVGRRESKAVARATVYAAMALAGLGRQGEAAARLSGFPLVDLPERHHEELLELAETLDLDDQVVAVGQQAIAHAFAERQEALADHVAQHIDARAQHFGIALARASVRLGRPIDAFLALESVSGLSWYDRVTRYFRGEPTNPVVGAIGMLGQIHATYAKTLDEFAGRMAGETTGAQRELLRELGQKAGESAGEFRGFSDLDPVLEAAVADITRDTAQHLLAGATASSPITALKGEAKRHADEHARMLRVNGLHFPETRVKPVWTRAMELADVEPILDGEPGRVLVRVHLGAELLAVALWRSGGRTVAKALRRPVDAQQISELHRGATADEATLAHTLLALDLGDILPEDAGHVVLLPSLIGFLVPWAATGHVPLVQRCRAISVLPSLVALWGRQSPGVERRGTLTVVPGSAGPKPTRHHAVALAAPLGDEQRLLERAATRGGLGEAAARADVVMFYAHGEGGPGRETSGIHLSDGLLDEDDLDGAWAGVERVELWACRSGVNLPTDWITPLVDDGFGLDITFHDAGVRSTIGTLWDANDFVTACLVHRYRGALRAGSDAPHALATAQRWWIDDAVPELERRLCVQSEDTAIHDFLAKLGSGDPAEPKLTGQLGPLSSHAALPPSDLKARMSLLRSPLSWAGYRFVGVSERRPLGVARSNPEMSAAERVLFQQLLTQNPEVEHSPGDLWDQWIAEEHEQKAVTAEGAIRVARLYAGRRHSRPAHNLARGLAWLHEALSQRENQGLARLRTEAAWLWLELAMGEASDPLDVLMVQPSEAVLKRVTDLAGPGIDGAVLREWAAVLGARPDSRVERAQKGWRRLAGTLDAADLEPHARWRLWAAAAELLLVAGPTPSEVARLDALDARAPVRLEQAVVWSRWSLYRSLCHELVEPGSAPPPVSLFVGPDDIRVTGGSPQDRLSQSRPGSASDEQIEGFRVDDLPVRDLGYASSLLYTRLAKPDLREDARIELSRCLELVEAAFWGIPMEDLATFHRTTGSPGRAWRANGGRYLSDGLREPRAERHAAHFLAWLHLSADLRVGAMGRLALLSSQIPGRSPHADLHALSWARAWLAPLLEDVAALPVLAPELDAFSVPTAALRSGLVHAEAPAALWQLGHLIDDLWDVDFSAYTAAMSAERQLHWLEEHSAQAWSVVQQTLTELEREHVGLGLQVRALLDPGIRVAEIKQALDELPAGEVVLGLAVGGTREILAFAVWNDGTKRHGRVHAAAPISGEQLGELIGQLHRPLPSDDGPSVGTSGKRQRAWQDLCAFLDPILVSVIGEAAHPNRHLRVFAPGPVRALPLVGLTLGGVPLRRRFRSVTHQLDLRSGLTAAAPRDTRPLICTFGDERESGETAFGGAAITTLRRWFPPDRVAEPAQPRGTEVVEVEPIQSGAPKATIVRFYGVGAPNEVLPTDAALCLSGGRKWLIHNSRFVIFGRCRAVEVWAATSRSGERWGATQRGCDTLPTLVRAFLMAGAHGVLDLAFPVHDLVKALVVERFSVIRERTGASESPALSVALGEVEAELARWARAAHPSVAAALADLDAGRRRWASESGLNSASIEPFEPLAQAPSVAMPVAGLVEVLTWPVQLAAFRWWGA